MIGRTEAQTAICDAIAAVAPDVDVASITGDTDLRFDLDLDSMDFLNWMIGISQATAIESPQRDAVQFLTIDVAAAYLTARAA